ncbi:MAG: hypothetical protein ACEPOW_07310 [Bacteroidales bacterium]
MKRAELKLNKVTVTNLETKLNKKAANTQAGMNTCKKCHNSGDSVDVVTDIVTTIIHG